MNLVEMAESTMNSYSRELIRSLIRTFFGGFMYPKSLFVLATLLSVSACSAELEPHQGSDEEVTTGEELLTPAAPLKVVKVALGLPTRASTVVHVAVVQRVPIQTSALLAEFYTQDRYSTALLGRGGVLSASLGPLARDGAFYPSYAYYIDTNGSGRCDDGDQASSNTLYTWSSGSQVTLGLDPALKQVWTVVNERTRTPRPALEDDSLSFCRSFFP